MQHFFGDDDEPINQFRERAADYRERRARAGRVGARRVQQITAPAGAKGNGPHMSAPTNRDPTSIEEIVNALRVVQRLACSLAPGRRQALLVVALERALATAEHYDTPAPAPASPHLLCPYTLNGAPCVLLANHPQDHRSLAGQVWPWVRVRT